MAEIWAWLEDRLSKRMAAARPAATTVNTAADWDLSVTLQAANSTNGDTITLDAMTVVLF